MSIINQIVANSGRFSKKIAQRAEKMAEGSISANLRGAFSYGSLKAHKEVMEGMTEAGGRAAQQAAESKIGPMFSKHGIDPKAADAEAQLMKKMGGDRAGRAEADGLIRARREGNAMTEWGQAMESGNMLDKGMAQAESFFWNPGDKLSTRLTRVGAAYGAVAGGSRLLSGGSLTRDGQGRPDIAGVPFV